MIRRNKECKTELLHEVRGGKGELLSTTLVTKEELFDHAKSLGYAVLKPNSSVGDHSHFGESEIFYILSGNPEYHDDDKVLTLNPGDVAICEDGHSHGIVNNTENDVVYIATVVIK